MHQCCVYICVCTREIDSVYHRVPELLQRAESRPETRQNVSGETFRVEGNSTRCGSHTLRSD